MTSLTAALDFIDSFELPTYIISDLNDFYYRTTGFGAAPLRNMLINDRATLGYLIGIASFDFPLAEFASKLMQILEETQQGEWGRRRNLGTAATRQNAPARGRKPATGDRSAATASVLAMIARPPANGFKSGE